MKTKVKPNKPVDRRKKRYRPYRSGRKWNPAISAEESARISRLTRYDLV